MRKYALGMGALLLAFMLGPPKTLRAGTIGLTLSTSTNYPAMGGVYVGPYNFTGTGSQSLQLVCDDFADDVSPGESWTATTSTFPLTSSVLFDTQFSDYQTRYKEVGWLVQQMFSLPTNSPNYSQTIGDIQWAIWDIFDVTPNGPISDGHNNPWGTLSAQDQCNIDGYGCTNSNNWLAQAQANYASGNYSNLVIYTPTTWSSGRPQEYFGLQQSMPESMTFWTLLVALATIALTCRWADKATVKPTASGEV